MAKKIVAALISVVLLFSVVASAEQIQIEPKFLPVGSNSLLAFRGVINGSVLEKQYTYGGTYNPLVLVCESANEWDTGVVAVGYDLGKSFPAGTKFELSCGGWYSKSYSFSSLEMYAALDCPTSIASYDGYLASRSKLDPVSTDGAIQTSNGNYKARLFKGSYTLPTSSRYIYLVFEISLSSVRNGGTYLGVSCSSISYEGNTDTEVNANNKGNGAVDSVMDAVNLNTSIYTGALSGLVQAVSYAGTDAVLPIPAIKLPALGADGVELELMPERTYDFADAFAMVPSQILLLVRSLATAALVWFAVKEVVGFIQYFLTLRGGETSE